MIICFAHERSVLHCCHYSSKSQLFWKIIKQTPITLLEVLLSVGKHKKLTDKQTGAETKKRKFTDIIKKRKLPRDILNKGQVEQLKEVFGKELNRLGRAS